MNQEDFVTYEQALAVKKLGFDEPCLVMSEHKKTCVEREKPEGCQLHNLHCGYPDCTIDKTITPIPLPSKSQVFRWFRDNHRLQHSINWNKHYPKSPQEWEVRKQWTDEPVRPYGYGGMSASYEEAESACIDKLIELVKLKQ